MVRILLAGCLFALVTACAPDRPQAATTEGNGLPATLPVSRPMVRPGEVMLPDRLRLPTVETVKLADSWGERLSSLSGTERARLESLNARYYGVLEFDSAEEQQQLIDAGVPASRIRAVGHGADEPVADNGTAEGRARNRRVEVLVSGG